MVVKSLLVLSSIELIKSGKSRDLLVDNNICRDLQEEIAATIIGRWWRHRIEILSDLITRIPLINSVNKRRHGMCDHLVEHVGTFRIPFLFDVPHGDGEWYDLDGYPRVFAKMIFGKLHGRRIEFTDDQMHNVTDFKMGSTHGILTVWNTDDCIGIIEFYLDNQLIKTVSVNREMYIKMQHRTEDMKDNDWYDFDLGKMIKSIDLNGRIDI